MYWVVPSDEVRMAGPSAVPPPQSPFLLIVPCETEFPPVKARIQLSVERNEGQFEGIVTKGGGGPVRIGFCPQAGLLKLGGALGSQWVVPFMVELLDEEGEADAAGVIAVRLPKPSDPAASVATLQRKTTYSSLPLHLATD